MMTISLLLPTRKRTKLVHKMVKRLIKLAKKPSNLEILIAIDDDDQESIDYFNSQEWNGMLAKHNIQNKVLVSERHGYIALYKYVNALGLEAQGDWLFFINDDCVFETKNWDKIIERNTGYFGVLRAQSNHNHPFALFPIIPKRWVEEFGMVSAVNHSDWWVYNCAARVGQLRQIPIQITHNRMDITGLNDDETYAEQDYSTDGRDPTNPADYSHPERQHDLVVWQRRILEIINE